MSEFVVVTPYNPGKTDNSGRTYLVRMPERKWLSGGEIVVCEKPNRQEVLYTVVTPEFSADPDIVMGLWGINEETIRTVVAVLRREDLDVADESVMKEEPTIE